MISGEEARRMQAGNSSNLPSVPLCTGLQKNGDGVTLALLEGDCQPREQQWVWQEMTAHGWP